MEQKQLDEIDESYFGEEFVEEEVKKKPVKKTAKKSKASKEKKAPVDEITITPVKEEVKPLKTTEPINPESTPPIDPWADMDEEQPKSGGSWKALTGLLVILLIASIFTNGFNFDGSPTGAVVADVISLQEAEEQALKFVNSNLLQPPFVATVESSSDEGSLYKVSLSVAGQAVDSYITKDGKLFFPQGFDTTATIPSAAPSDLEPVDAPVVEVPVEEVEVSEPIVEEPEVVEDPVAESVEEVPTEVEPEPTVTDVTIVPLLAKKWSFRPDTLQGEKGDLLQLTISPDTTNPAFALDEFTFAIEELGVEETVSGTTVVTVPLTKSGKFTFTCSSCEAWRGMSGTLVVE
mgnify:CR=1 FL=1|tara:strand:+ start:9799 stop:10842 length:1044 start_codon:yes stop_codon:yes gene_type:complete